MRLHLPIALGALSVLATASIAACSSTSAETAPDGSAPPVTSPPSAAASTADATDPPPPIDASGPADAAADRAVPATVQARIAAYDAALARAVCAKLTSCCSTADLDAYTAQFAETPYKVTTKVTAANCEAVLTEAFDALYLKKWGTSVAVGNIELSDARAAACVSSVGAAACGLPLTTALYDAACFGIRGNEVFKKVGKIGAPCDDIGDTTFIGECDPTAGYCGEEKRCVPWRKTGEECGILLQDAGPAKRLFCAPGTNCDGSSPRNPGRCSGPPRTVALGDTCTALSGPDLVCPAGAYCDVLGTRQCVAQKADGEACASDDECRASHPYTCLAPRTDGGAGGAKRCGSVAFCGGR